jgi:hypothetical protein
MKGTNAIKTFRNSLFWRHKFIWCYRFDIYLALLFLCLGFFSVCGIIYICSVNYNKSTIEQKLIDVADKETRLASVAYKLTYGSTNADDVRQLREMLIIDSNDSQASTAAERIVFRIAENRNDTTSLLEKKIKELVFIRSDALSTIARSYLFLGWFIGNPFAALGLFLPMVILISALIGVFHSRETGVVQKHPLFGVILIQLALFFIVPVGMAVGLEDVFGDLERDIIESKVAKPLYEVIPIAVVSSYDQPKGIVVNLDVQTPTSALMISDEKMNFLSTGTGVYLAVLAWIACSISILRRFDEGRLAGFSTILAGVLMVSLSVLFAYFVPDDKLFDLRFWIFAFRWDDQSGAIWGLIAFSSIIMLIGGAMTNWYRRQIMATGFIGVVVSTSGLVGATVGLKGYTFLAFSVVVFFVITVSALVEAGLRRTMFRFFYDPL